MLLNNDLGQIFLQLFQKSVELKNAGLLNSSLKKRIEATGIAETHGNLALRAIGKANEATLLGYHIGDGLAAFEAAKEALSNIELFIAADAEWHELTGLMILDDILGIIRQWSFSFEEFFKYHNLFMQHCPSAEANQTLQDTLEQQKQDSRWWIAQLGIAYQKYSRDKPELDAGFYAQGMSILQCILTRAEAEEPGYELNYDEYIHLLDDYIVISQKQANTILLKYQQSHNWDNPDDADEIFVILRNPIHIWQKFMPEMQGKDKKLFSDYFQMYWLQLAMIHKQDEMESFYSYFPDAIMRCPNCGKNISKTSQMCRYCSKIFDNSVKLPPELGSPSQVPQVSEKSGNRWFVLFAIISAILLIIYLTRGNLN